eukprot:TRINITY_DN62039_c0_g1_i2.p1 TRINITY_DN62039_c0_g1~~TRINITY_DN62039_c0_g1_i2.p1  ORF type:complete len:156 (-),score=0.13 TRINITY_DN62039_c0_g1_i2:138-605(-)
MFSLEFGEDKIVCNTDQSVDSTGAKRVWDAGLALAKYFERNVYKGLNIKGKKCVELGAGVGLTGLTLHKLYDCPLISTDLPIMIPLLQHNIGMNQNLNTQIPAVACVLDWTEDCLPSHEGVDWSDIDIIVATDCIYREKFIPDLVNTMKRLASML